MVWSEEHEDVKMGAEWALTGSEQNEILGRKGIMRWREKIDFT